MKIEEALDIIINTDYSKFTNKKQERAFDMALFALSIWVGVKEDVSGLESLGDPAASVFAESFKNYIREIEKIGD